jgi:hypothetical protein
LVSIAYQSGWTIEYVLELELCVIWDIIEINNPESTKDVKTPEEIEIEMKHIKKANQEMQRKAREKQKKTS